MLYLLPMRSLDSVFSFNRLGAFLFDMFETFVIALALVVVVYLFIASPHEVIGQSMEKNFHTGEYILANKFEYRISKPKRGDVIIFKHSEAADFIKRIIGLPGDKVELNGGKFYINDKILEEPYLAPENRITPGGDFLEEGEFVIVPEGKLFVVGDNRNSSSDSRAWGFLDLTEIKGKAWLVYWPISSFHIVQKQSYTADK
jgi:signal peptidase I